MISIRKVFSNKHRAYLLIFTCAYLALRLPILVSNKIERLILGAIVDKSSDQGLKTAYKGFRYEFPAKVSFDQLEILNKQGEPIQLDKVILASSLSYPFKVSFNADVFKGRISCNFQKGIFSPELGVSCNSNNFDFSEIPYLKQFAVNGPLSFKFNGHTFTNRRDIDISGEFLSQIDSSNLKLPKEIPSIVKIPNMGIMDLKGNFSLKNDLITLTETSVASSAGDVDINLSVECSPGFYSVLNLDTLLKVKLSSSGIQSIGPWIGLALGGIQYPSSGQANIEVKGNSTAGFKSKLLN